jgi:hypothetical protein
VIDSRLLTASRLALVLALPVAALPAAAAAGADNGGTTPPSDTPPPAEPADLTMTAPRSAFVRDRVRISGSSHRARRRVVRIERRLAAGTWTLVTRVRADRKGGFTAVWRPRRAGSYELRARAGTRARGGNGGTPVPVEIGAEGAGSSSYLTVYESAIATWYGPGFFGNLTACGMELTESTLGVAHRELPCGTQVQFAFRGRAIVLPVIDRGPFANDAEWDLTQAAAQQLGMTGTSRIGAMRVSPSG